MSIPKLLIPQLSEKLAAVIDKSLKVNPGNRISAAGIEAILGKGDNPAVKKSQWDRFTKSKFFIPATVAMVMLVVLFFIFSGKDEIDPVKPALEQVIEDAKKEDPVIEQKTEKINQEPAHAENKIIINVPGISNAELILNDGSHQPLPYSVKGKDGDKFEFTIHADGYKDKDVQVVLTPRRMSYEFNLEKNNR